MKYAIVYTSRTGNTKMLADCIRETLPKENCIYFGGPSQAALEADLIYVGFWTRMGKCDPNTQKFLKLLKKQKVFLFGTSGFGKNEAYRNKVIRRSVKKVPTRAKVIGTFVCQGKLTEHVKEKYEHRLHNPFRKKKALRSIENFEIASTHPDANDLKNLTNVVERNYINLNS